MNSIMISSSSQGVGSCTKLSICTRSMVRELGPTQRHGNAEMSILGPIVRVTPDEIHIKDSTWSEVLYTGYGSVRFLDQTVGGP